MTDWTNRLAGARMQVDQQFQDRVAESQFSNQQWGLIMTAVEWEVENPEDDEAARLVADTSNFGDVIPELDRIEQQVGPGADPEGIEDSNPLRRAMRKVANSVSLSNAGGGSNQEQLDEAAALVQEYSEQLQAFLERKDRWAEIREAAAAEQPSAE
mgnify:FL=1